MSGMPANNPSPPAMDDVVSFALRLFQTSYQNNYFVRIIFFIIIMLFSDFTQMKVKFSSEDIRILQECNKESFYNRCLPLSGLFGFATYSAIKSGLLCESFYLFIKVSKEEVFVKLILTQ